ncbi:putative MFS family arabinose efflux permease [Volucribacter psittacicida]|uniref:Putative MFS family arabinose efflux permease n=1 Tax=Volucribacter psittacicida TaxID=203482 RepID=A0A4R1FYK5_9PAST|nr:MFS transporter [Volucribacter psittacicida]TCJ98869.1 putative MFS family arabinose efflux permease [Volucribacter psittacicida]
MSKDRAFSFKILGINFWRYRLAFVITTIGNMAVSIAITWWIIDFYHKAIYVSYVMIPSVIVAILTNFLLAPLGDKFDRKKIIEMGLMIQFFSCFIILLPQLLDQLSLSFFIVFYLLFSLGGGIVRVGSMGFIANIVNKSHLLLANNMIMRINALVSILSGVIGGVLFYQFGLLYAFLLLMLLQIIALILIHRINILFEKEGHRKNKINWLIGDLYQGIQYTLKSKILSSLFVYSLIVGLAFGPMQLIIIYLIKIKFELNAFSYGIAMSFMAIGVVFGSLIYHKVASIFQLKSRFVFFSSYLFCVAFILLGLFNYLIIFSISLLLIGMARNWINVTVDTRLLTALPDKIRTRVLANMSFFGNISVPIANLFTGFILDNSHIFIILSFNCIMTLLASCVFVFNQSVIRFIDLEDEDYTQFLK